MIYLRSINRLTIALR